MYSMMTKILGKDITTIHIHIYNIIISQHSDYIYIRSK